MAYSRTRKPWALRIYCGLVGLVLIAPTLVVIPMSFTDQQSFTFPPSGWSFRWYRNFFEDPNWHSSAVLSIRIGLLVMVVATVVGTLAALALMRSDNKLAVAFQGLVMAPLIVPGVITAIGIYYVFLRWHLTQTTIGFVLAHTIMALPLVVVPISAALQTYDRRLDDAAASLGSSPLTTLFRVTLPLIAPAVLTGALFAFMTSFDESIVSLFLSGPFMRTLPIQMYQSVTAEVDPTIAAASTMLIVITTLLLLVVGIIANRKASIRG